MRDTSNDPVKRASPVAAVNIGCGDGPRADADSAQAIGRDRALLLLPMPHSARRGTRGCPSRAAIVAALDMMPQAVFFCNDNWEIIDANAAAITSSGYCRAELQDMRIADAIVDGGDGRLPEALERTLRGEIVERAVPARLCQCNGGWLDIDVRFKRVVSADGSVTVVTAHSCAEPAEPDDGHERGGGRDFLTALPTRAALESRLRRAKRHAQRRRGRFAVLFIDVDRFKGVNDTSGHRTGDLVLKVFARRLLASLRPGDFVARYGGDEFVAIVEDFRTDAEVERIAERIQAELTAPIHLAGGQFQISVSLGIAIGDAAASAQALIDEADRAMYRVKRSKRANHLDAWGVVQSGPKGDAKP